MSLTLEPMGERPVVDIVRNNGFDFGKRTNLIFVGPNRVAYISGRSVIFASFDESGNMYEDGEVLYGLENGGIGDIAVSHDFEHIAVAERSRTRKPNIYVYSLRDLKKVSTLVKGTERGYASCAFNKFTPNLLVSLGQAPDYMLSVWDWPSERVILKFKAFSQEVYNVQWSPTVPNHLTTAGMGHIRFWKLADTFTGRKLQGELGKFGQTELSDVVSYAELPDGKVVSSTEYGRLLLWEGVFVKAELIDQRGGNCHEGAISVVMTDPSNERLLVSVGEADATIRWWDRDVIDLAEATEDSATTALECLREVALPLGAKVTHVLPEPSKPWVWLLLDAAHGAVWRLDTQAADATCQQIFGKPSKGVVAAAPVACASGCMIVANQDGSISVMDVAGGAEKEVSRRQWKRAVTALIPNPCDPSGRTVFAGFADGVVRELRTDGSVLQVVSALKPHSCAVKSLTVTPNGMCLASVDEDGSIFFLERPPLTPEQISQLNRVVTGGENLTLGPLVLPPLQPVGFVDAPGVIRKSDAPEPSKQDMQPRGEESEEDAHADDSSALDALEEGRPRPKQLLGEVAAIAFSYDGLNLNLCLSGGAVAQIERPFLGSVHTEETFMLDLPFRVARLELPSRPADRDIAAEVQAKIDAAKEVVDLEPEPLYETPAQKEARLRRNAKKLAKKAQEADAKAREAAAAAEADQEERLITLAKLEACSFLKGLAHVPTNPPANQDENVPSLPAHALVVYGSGKFSSALWTVDISTAPLQTFKIRAPPKGTAKTAPLADLPGLEATPLAWLPYPGEGSNVTAWPSVSCVSSVVTAAPPEDLELSQSRVTALVGYADSTILALPIGAGAIPNSAMVLPLLRNGPAAAVCAIQAIVTSDNAVDPNGTPIPPLVSVGAADGTLVTGSLAVDHLFSTARWNDAGRATVPLTQDPHLETLKAKVVACEAALKEAKHQAELVVRYKPGEEMEDGRIFESDGQEEKRLAQADTALSLAIADRDVYASKIPPRDVVGIAPRRAPEEPSPILALRAYAQASVAVGLPPQDQALKETEASPSTSTSAQQDLVSDLPDEEDDHEGAVYSIEEQKARAGEDAAEAAAADEKARVRVNLDALRSELLVLRERNAQLSDALPEEALIVDRDSNALARIAGEQRRKQTEREVARDRERATLQLQKATAHLLGDVDQEEVSVRGLRRREAVAASLRTLKLGDDVMEQLALAQEVVDEFFGVEDNLQGALNGTHPAGMALGATQQMLGGALGATQQTGGLNATGAVGGLNNTTSALMQQVMQTSTASRHARQQRRAEIMKLKNSPPPSSQTPEEAAALRQARELFGLLELRLHAARPDAKLTVQRLGALKTTTAASHRVKLALLAEGLYAARQEFNSRVLRIREQKGELLAFLSRALASLRQLGLLLQTSAPLPQNHPALLATAGQPEEAATLLMAALNRIQGQSQFAQNAAQQLAADLRATAHDAPSRRLVETWDSQFLSVMDEAAKLLNSGEGDFLSEHPERRLIVSESDLELFKSNQTVRHPRLDASSAPSQHPEESYCPRAHLRETQLAESGKLVGNRLTAVLHSSQEQLQLVSSPAALAKVVARETIAARRQFLREVRVKAIGGSQTIDGPSGGDSSSGRCLVERRVRLLKEKRALEIAIQLRVCQFDQQIGELALERASLEWELTCGEQHLLNLGEQLVLLDEMTSRDEELEAKLLACRQEEVQVHASLRRLQDSVSFKEQQVAKRQQELAAIQQEFEAITVNLPGPTKLIVSRQLAKPQALVKAAGNFRAGNDEDDENNEIDDVLEESDDDFDSDDDDDDDDDDESEEESDSDEDEAPVDDSTPTGCDPSTHDDILALRDRRWATQADLSSIHAALTRDHEEVKAEHRRLQAVQDQRQRLLQEEATFLHAKLRRLNGLLVSVPLKLSSIRNLVETPEARHRALINGSGLVEGALPLDLTTSVLVGRADVDRLRGREAALRQEAAEESAEARRLRAELRASKKEEQQIEERKLKANKDLEELQLLRFGQTVDLDLLERAEPSSKMQSLRVQLEEREAQTAAEIKEEEKRLKELKQEHARATLTNTQLLAAISQLGHQQMALDQALAAQMQKVTVGDNGPTDRIARMERQEIERALKLQVQEIATLQGEINLFKRKGGHIFSTVTAPPSAQQGGYF